MNIPKKTEETKLIQLQQPLLRYLSKQMFSSLKRFNSHQLLLVLFLLAVMISILPPFQSIYWFEILAGWVGVVNETRSIGIVVTILAHLSLTPPLPPSALSFSVQLVSFFSIF